MKALHINTRYKVGGAARAMQRLHDQLVARGHESKFLVGRSKAAHEPGVDLVAEVVSGYGSIWDGFLSRFGNRFEDLWGIHPWAYRPTLKLPQTEIYHWADLIDLRNLFGDYLNLWVLPELTQDKPVVWRLPDLWALTGHCAYPYGCQRWITGCFDCPLLTEEGRKIVEPPPTKWDGTRWVWHAKKEIYSESNLHIIVTTRWMKVNVEKSVLQNALSINVISNGVDLDIYKPYDREQVRRELNLPRDKKIAIFAAAELSNHRKGYTYAKRAMERLQGESQDPPLLITMGSTKGIKSEADQDHIKHFGFVRDARVQAKLFRAADVFLCPTLADAQPQTALESIACGTPVIGFDVGPMPDLIGDEECGWIATAIDPTALGKAVAYAFSHPATLVEMGARCRQKAVREYDLTTQTNRYIALYEDLLT